MPRDFTELAEILAVAERAGDRALEVRTLSEMGWCRLADGQNASGVHSLREAAMRAEKIGEAELGRALVELGRALLSLDRAAIAERAFQTAASLLDGEGDVVGGAEAAMAKADARSRHGDSGMAEAAYAEVVRRCETAGLRVQEARARVNAAKLARARGDRGRTLEWLDGELEPLEDERDEDAVWARGELGALLFGIGRLADAAPLLERAAVEETAAGRQDEAARRWHILGRTAMQLGDRETARRAFTAAVERWRAAANPQGEATSYAALAEMLAGVDTATDALRFAERAVEIAARVSFVGAAARGLDVLMGLAKVDGAHAALSRAARALDGAGFAALAERARARAPAADAAKTAPARTDPAGSDSGLERRPIRIPPPRRR